MRQYPEPERDDLRLAPIMHALSDPIRLALVTTCADGEEHNCTELDEVVGVQKSTTSHHLRVLRESGLTSTRQQGRTRLVRLRRTDLDARFPGLLDAILTAAADPSTTTSGHR